jgi:putative phosphoribosyl transferase
MIDQVKKILHDREHASRLLVEKLHSYKNSNAVIVAIPPGGIPVGNQLALSLQLPLETMIVKPIKHPAHSERSIGAVTVSDVFLQESACAIPQHYIYHQIHQLQHQIKIETEAQLSRIPKQNLKDRPVIICDTLISHVDSLSACLQSIRAQKPSRIIVATLLATSKAAFFMTGQEIEFHYINMILNRDHDIQFELCEDENEILSPYRPFSELFSFN